MSCPNINSREWKDLVAVGGEEFAYRVFALDPTLGIADKVVASMKKENTALHYAAGVGSSASRSTTAKTAYAETLAKRIVAANSATNRPTYFDTLINNGTKAATGITYRGLTTVDGVLNKYRQEAFLDSKEYIEREADELYKNIPPGGKIKPTFSTLEMTKDEYIEYKTQLSERYANLGKVKELVLTIPLMGDVTAVDAAQKELEDLYAKLAKFVEYHEKATGDKKFKAPNEFWFKWALGEKEYPNYVNRMLKKLGLHDMLRDDDFNTRYAFQVEMHSTLLKTKAVLDMLITHGDHRYSIVDFKAGHKFAHMSNSIPLRFFRQLNTDMTDNPIIMAKLQIMWEALLVRINDPKAIFESLKAVNVSEKDDLYKTGNVHYVDPREFLPMLEALIREESMDTYNALKAADPDIFNYKIYQGKSSEIIKQEESIVGDKRRVMLDQITQEVLYRKEFMRSNRAVERLEQDERIRELLNVFMEMNPDNVAKIMPGFSPGNSYKNIRDLSLAEYWIGSAYNIKHPLVSSVLEIVHSQVIEMTKEYQKDNIIFKDLMTKIAKHYVKHANPSAVSKFRNIIADPAANISIALKKILGSYDHNALNNWAYITKYNPNNNKDEEFLVTSETELLKNIRDHPEYNWIMDGGKIYKPFVDMITFLNDRYSSFLDHARGDSLWNQPVSYKIIYENGRPKRIPVTYGEEINSSEVRKRSPFVYLKGMFPKVARMQSEIDGFTGSGFKHFFRRYFTNFYEQAFDEYNNESELIPIMGLGNNVSSNPDEYSRSLENQFETFIKSALAKKHLTSAYAFIEAVKIMNIDPESGGVINERLQSFIKGQQMLGLRGRRPQLSNTSSRALPFTFGFDKKDTGTNIRTLQSWDLGKTILSLGALTSYIRLGFNLMGGAKNALGISLSSFTEASKQSIMQKLYNDPNATSFVKDFTTMNASEYLSAMPEAIAMQGAAMQGKLNENKLWVLMNQFGYIPSISPLRKEQKYFVTDSTSIFSPDIALAPYSTSEEVLIGTFFRAQMEHIKVEQGPMKGKSLWDMYEEVTKIDPATGIEYKTWEYKKDENGDPYVRGVIVDSKDNVTKLTELSNKEVMAMHAVYEEKQGGFAQLDRSNLETTIMGQVLVQFRRHLQSIIRHGIQTYGENYIKGRYQNTGKTDVDGNIIYEFSAKTVEGKWMTITGMLLRSFGNASKIFGKDNKVSNFIEENFPKGLDEYAWDKLDQGQKENLIDIGLTVSLFVVYKALSYLAYGGGKPDPDDKYYLWTQKVMAEALQHLYIWQIYKDINQTPAFMKVFASMVGGFSQIGWSYLLWGADSAFDTDLIDEEDYLTREDKFRGETQTSGTLPIYTSIRNTYRFFEDPEEE